MNPAYIASKNFIAKANEKCRFYAPKTPSFTRPNPNNGYGAILKLLASGNQPSRKAILRNLNLPTQDGYYASVFMRLLWANLISYDSTNGYMLTLLGHGYVDFYNLIEDPALEDDSNEDVATIDERPSWMSAYDAAMKAYAAAMDAYKVAMSNI